MNNIFQQKAPGTYVTVLPNFPPAPVTAVNLRNVAIHGGKVENFLTLATSRTFNLTFPAGNSWRGKGKGITAQTAKPFD